MTVLRRVVPMVIRRAVPSEAAVLTALAIRSKAHWGYDAAFMERAAEDLAITAELLEGAAAFVAEGEREVLGFYVLGLENGAPTLRELWIEPVAIGKGLGRLLWTHMLGEARGAGYQVVRIVSEPNAQGFYAKMGARTVGEVESPVVKGRMLPVMEVVV
jgi:GNAT superfamily N-acetyltransferase